MLHWWFTHLEGEIEVQGRRLERYRVWHPLDHVAVRYARRRADGSVGPGAAIHLHEVIGRNPRYRVDVVTDIEKLDESGFIHNPVFHGLRGLARMEYTFAPVAGGTQYDNCLIFGGTGVLTRPLSRLVAPLAFPSGKGEAWIRHNVEEVGLFEHFLPALYRKETGLRR